MCLILVVAASGKEVERVANEPDIQRIERKSAACA